MASLRFRNVWSHRDGTALLRDIDLDVAHGELVGVVGASGAGKSSMLRVIAGLERVTSGAVWFDDVDMTDARPGDRDVAMVFQEPVLIPHLDVRHNVSFPLDVRHRHIEEITLRVDAEARALHIQALLERSPNQLSAGEAQLVQIARAMVRVPSVLLLDEPLSRLDAAIRDRMRHELSLLQRGYGVTTFVATNDPIEAMAMPDRLVVLDAGQLVQVGTPLDVYRRPATVAAAVLTGDADVVEVDVTTCDGGFWLTHRAFRHRAWLPALEAYVGRRLDLLTRPAWATVSADGTIDGTVRTSRRVGANTRVRVSIGDDEIDVSDEVRDAVHSPNEPVRVRLDDYALYDPRTGRRIGGPVS